jgi:hypothetical protein
LGTASVCTTPSSTVRESTSSSSSWNGGGRPSWKRTASGDIPLHRAVLGEVSEERVHIVAERFSPRALQVKDRDGRVPLHVAILFGARVGVVERASRRGGSTPSGRRTAPAGCCRCTSRPGTSWRRSCSDASWTGARRMTTEGSRCTGRPVPGRKWWSESSRTGGSKALQAKDNAGWIPLHHAAHRPSISGGVVRYLVDKCPRSLQKRTLDGCVYLPLHVAVKWNQSADVVRVLADTYPGALEERTDDDNDGLLPLHVAVTNRCPDRDLVRFVLGLCPHAFARAVPRRSTPVERRRAVRRAAGRALSPCPIGAGNGRRRAHRAIVRRKRPD